MHAIESRTMSGSLVWRVVIVATANISITTVCTATGRAKQIDLATARTLRMHSKMHYSERAGHEFHTAAAIN